MNEDKALRIILYAKNAGERDTPLIIRDIAKNTRVSQINLFDFIEGNPNLKLWTIAEDGEPIRRQGDFVVEYVHEPTDIPSNARRDTYKA